MNTYTTGRTTQHTQRPVLFVDGIILPTDDDPAPATHHHADLDSWPAELYDEV